MERRGKKRRKKGKRKTAYLAVEVRFDHLCILTGQHGASQAENHTHGRQQHEQWYLHETHFFLIPSWHTPESKSVFQIHDSQTYHQCEGSPPRYHSYYSRSHNLQGSVEIIATLCHLQGVFHKHCTNRNWKWFYFLMAKYSAMKKYLFPPVFLYICIFVTLNGFTSSYKITWKHKTHSLNDPFIYWREKLMQLLLYNHPCEKVTACPALITGCGRLEISHSHHCGRILAHSSLQNCFRSATLEGCRVSTACLRSCQGTSFDVQVSTLAGPLQNPNFVSSDRCLAA